MSSVAEKLQRKSQKPAATKQVRLKLVYVDFWSALKFSFLVSISLGIILVVATIFIWVVLASTSVFSSIDSIMQQILSDNTYSVSQSVSLPQVALFAIVVALLNTVIGTALGAIASLLYNFSVKLTGGLLVGFTNQ
ncbi:DUF3566 domain-containing protein [Galbitalea soli]|uniref:DUF3566 domain-containing protein n=1 Tax=Galbitalea soli TaxID=1268042 RepID=A0A7C9PNX3_9MICO|nr:DUF3566 domain-containing protein [Galbitalea soli]NEM91751.1 DUF3566 domain-containing protein [Galbitalea soli]NYJ29415.1 putative membrane protein [Galbitalea soli]